MNTTCPINLEFVECWHNWRDCKTERYFDVTPKLHSWHRTPHISQVFTQTKQPGPIWRQYKGACWKTHWLHLGRWTTLTTTKTRHQRHLAPPTLGNRNTRHHQHYWPRTDADVGPHCIVCSIKGRKWITDWLSNRGSCSVGMVLAYYIKGERS